MPRVLRKTAVVARSAVALWLLAGAALALAPAPSSAVTTEPFLKVHVPRLVGLAMLNGVGVLGLNSLGTLYFNVGRGFPIRTFTFRAAASMAPDDYRVALAADARSMLGRERPGRHRG